MMAHPSQEWEPPANPVRFIVEDIDHTRTKVKSPQTNGICERFHKTVLDEFYRVAFRKQVYETVEMLQADLDDWLRVYKRRGPTRGAGASARRPCRLFSTSPIWRAKNKTQKGPHSEGKRQFGSGGHPPRQIEQNVRPSRYFYTCAATHRGDHAAPPASTGARIFKVFSRSGQEVCNREYFHYPESQ
jgi:hypothetical protein